MRARTGALTLCGLALLLFARAADPPVDLRAQSAEFRALESRMSAVESVNAGLHARVSDLEAQNAKLKAAENAELTANGAQQRAEVGAEHQPGDQQHELVSAGPARAARLRSRARFRARSPVQHPPLEQYRRLRELSRRPCGGYRLVHGNPGRRRKKGRAAVITARDRALAL